MTASANKPSRFWKELRRRKVLRSLAIYAGTAFLILEASTIIFPRWNFPDWSIDLVLWLLVLGAIINVFVAWFFDITTRGIQKTLPIEDADEIEKPSGSKAWKAATYLSLVVIVALIVLNIVGGPKQLRAGDIQSLLILPFDNFTGDDQLDLIAAGMHTSLIGDIGQISGLRTISKTTARNYKYLDLSLPEIAAELNADAVVEPIVMCYGDSVCVQIRVITPFPEEKQLWIGEYKVEKSQILSLYNQVSKEIAEELKIQLTPGEELLLAETKTINSEAYDYYLKGLNYWDLFTPEAFQLAIEYFNKAIEADPGWAEPYAGVAYVWMAMHQFGWAPSSLTVPNMYNNLIKAIELDPNSGFVHYVDAFVRGWVEWDWDKMETELQYALKKNPNDAFAHIYYAHMLACLRRGDEALTHCRIALDLDPLNPMILALSTMVLADAGEYDEAISLAEKALSILPGHPPTLANLIFLYVLTGEDRLSLESWTSLYRLDDIVRDSILLTYDQQGKIEAINQLANVLERTIGDYIQMDLGQLYALIGDEEKALACYNRAFQERNPMMPYIGTVFGSGGPYKIEDPGFDTLLLKLNIPLE